MAFQLTVKTLFGESRIIEFFDDVSIFDLKEHVKAYFSLHQCDINLIHNTKNLVTGTVVSNGIKSDDIIYITLNMNSGFNLTEKYRMENILESYKKFQKETTTKLEELESYVYELQNTEKQESTPLEILGRMQMEKQFDDDSYKSEDMRVLFQRCRDQIEDEYNKKQQTKKENDKIKRKLEELKNRMKMKKQKLNNIKPEIKKKETFCGFKKGFLL
jgi:hypothetical protein